MRFAEFMDGQEAVRKLRRREERNHRVRRVRLPQRSEIVAEVEAEPVEEAISIFDVGGVVSHAFKESVEAELAVAHQRVVEILAGS